MKELKSWLKNQTLEDEGALNYQTRSQRINEMEEDENDFAAKIEEKLGKFAADLYKDIKKSCVTEQDREFIEN